MSRWHAVAAPDVLVYYVAGFQTALGVRWQRTIGLADGLPIGKLANLPN